MRFAIILRVSLNLHRRMEHNIGGGIVRDNLVIFILHFIWNWNSQ